MGMVAETMVWEPTAKQEILLSCPVEDAFYGGTMGGGKSDGLLGDFLFHQMDYPQHARGLLLRKTHAEMLDLVMRSMEIYEPYGARWNWSRYLWQFPEGARLHMGYLERDAHVQRHMGASYTWLGADELTHWATADALDKIRSRLRSTRGVPCFFRGSGNPGFAGHNWVKMRYIDPAPPLTPFHAEVHLLGTLYRTERVFVPSSLEDNPHLDPHEYERQMAAAAGGDDVLFRGWRLGDWNIVAGGRFDAQWLRVREKALIAPVVVPQGWPIFRSFDWGESHPFSLGWWTISTGERLDDGRYFPRGSYIRIGEWYGWDGKTPNKGLSLSPYRIAQGIKDREQTWGIAGRVQPGPAGADLFTAQRGVRLADDFASAGIHFTEADTRPGSRKAGARQLGQLLEALQGDPIEKPGLFIVESLCRQWVRTVPVLPRDPKDPDDVDTSAEDHCYDETRYSITSPRMPMRRMGVTL